MDINKIKKLSTELWVMTQLEQSEIGATDQDKEFKDESTSVLARCLNMLKYATYIIDEAIEIYETL